ncbi:MAG TPA: hypothetical protein VNT55_06370 [Baekduia sp.]|nr:hypothetical protein [Baekduia sp.]
MTKLLHPTRPRTARLRTATVLMLGALWLSGAVARPAVAADDGVRWTVKPAANSFGADRKDYGYTLSPGGRQEDGIEVVNQGTTTLHLALRAADAVTTSAGRLGLVDRGARSKGVGAWVQLERDVVTVQPGATVTVPFVLTPPKNAAAGDHVGGIVAAPVGAAAADRRPGVQIRLRVSGPLKPGLAVGAVHMSYSNTANPLGSGDAIVTYTIRNTGNVILTARQSVSASGPFGTWARHAGRIADSPPLLPGGTWKVRAPLRDVTPALRLKATVKVTPLLADAAGSIAPLPAKTASGHAWAVPWSLLLVLIVVCGLAGVALRRRHRRPVGAVA